MLTRLASRITAFARRRRVEQEMDDEWRFHLESRIDALVDSGLDRAAAEEQARQEFGPVIKWKEESRDARGFAAVDGLRRDASYALRQLHRAPAFALLVILTLAIGIGANTAMFSIVDAVLLRPLRFPGADRASEVWMRTAEGASAQPGVTALAYAALREGLADVAGVEGYRFGAGTIVGGVEPIIVPIPEVSAGLLLMVGASPIIGRLYERDDALPGSTSVLISERIWASQFGRDPGIVGRRIDIDGEPHSIIGVLSHSARYPEARSAVWKPLDMAAASRSPRRIQTIVVRHVTVSPEQIDARVAALTRSLRAQGTLSSEQSLFTDDVVQARVSRSQGQPLWTLLGAVGLVLLVACANVMNLLLVRASNRRGELAVQSALGADRFALVRQAAIEVIVLVIAGTAAGLALAETLIDAVPSIVPAQIGAITPAQADLNWRVVGFACAMAVAVSLLAGLVPAWRSSRVDPLHAMKWHSRAVAGSGDERWQGALLALQIGTVLVLLCGSGLLLQSFIRLTRVDPGYDPSSLVTVSVQATASRYMEPGAALAAMQDLERRIQDAGIGQATLTAGTPFSFEIKPEGEGGLPVDATGMVLPWTPVSPNYFDTMRIPMLQGRTFAPGDDADVIVVSDRLARAFWGEQSAVGRRFRMDVDQPWRTVIGVVGDVLMMGIDDPTGHGMEFYTPHTRTRGGFFNLLVRSPLSPDVVVARVKEQLWNIDPGLPVTEAGPVRDALIDGLYRQRFVLQLTAAFAAITIVLAGVGIYGVASYWLANRRRDLAIRVALGAAGRHVVYLLLSRTAVVGAAGAAIGITGSMAAFSVLEPLLYETSALDPLVLAGTSCVIAALAIGASIGPVRAALAADPLTILREE